MPVCPCQARPRRLQQVPTLCYDKSTKEMDGAVSAAVRLTISTVSPLESKVISMNRKVYRLLMIAQGLLWLYMAVQSALSGIASYLIIVILMALNGACYMLLAFPDIRKPLFKFSTIAFLGVNTVLSFTDQLGFMDYLVIVWNLVLLVLTFSILLTKKQG